MPKYMLLLGGADLDKRGSNPALAPQLFEQFSRWLGSLRERGQYLQSHKLLDRTGARLTVRTGQVVEGPFMETKEGVGGVFLIEAASLEDAIGIARTAPTLTLQNGFVEVRVVEEVGRPGAA
ncbi:MAG TPA: YciI family protein [Polyangia bacterium]